MKALALIACIAAAYAAIALAATVAALKTAAGAGEGPAAQGWPVDPPNPGHPAPFFVVKGHR